MNFKSYRSYWEFYRTVRHENRYIHGTEVDDFLSCLLKTSSDRIREVKAGSVFWRSQLGNDWQPIEQDGVLVDEEPIPFRPSRMVPLKHEASEGRANPKGISYLYLATNKETAMSEIRPGKGAYISVGQFKTTKELRLIDCSVHPAKRSFFYLEEPDDDEKEVCVWADVDEAFSKPVTINDKSSDYVPTQIVAELFKNEGFHGIAYESALAEGHNVMLFDIESAKLINCFLHEVKEVNYSFEQIANPYFV